MSQGPEPGAVNPYTSPPPAEAPPDSPPALPMDGEIRALFERGKNGAAWFYWIGALSLINSLVSIGGGNIGFALGLAVTTVADSIAAGAAQAGQGSTIRYLALGFDLVIYALVFGCGWLSQKRILPVFAIGMFLYLLDGLIYVLFFDIVSIVIHGVALWGMWSGFMAYRHLNALEQRMLSGVPGGP
jgi:hypothetical protein